jgi:hypothetical protein
VQTQALGADSTVLALAKGARDRSERHRTTGEDLRLVLDVCE